MPVKQNANGKKRPFGRTCSARKRERGLSAGCILVLLFLLIALALFAIFISGSLRRMLECGFFDYLPPEHSSGEDTGTIEKAERVSGEKRSSSGIVQAGETSEGAAANDPAASAGDLPQTVSTLLEDGVADPVTTLKESDNHEPEQ